MQWIFRFMDKVPRGRFEYTCGICGHYEIVNIPKNLSIGTPIIFDCEKCGTKIYIWEQTNHWHMKIVREN